MEAVLGRYRNSEDLAYGLSGEPGRVLYKLAFRHAARWPGSAAPWDERRYADVYEHRLGPQGDR